ncbi:hypothetical protein [Hyphomicrobium sp. 2TAF46]|uniref:hypothetical protein n=1 Tax=Hyphomicrobium sp. 2TAF46 TaxID=3233019 RepID=UPI003F931927
MENQREAAKAALENLYLYRMNYSKETIDAVLGESNQLSYRDGFEDGFEAGLKRAAEILQAEVTPCRAYEGS